MKKNLLSVALIVSLVLSAAGCGETGSTITNAANNITADEDSVSITTNDETETSEDTTNSSEQVEKPVVEEIKVGSNKLVPDCPVNVSADIPLGVFYKPYGNTDDKRYDISEITVQEITFLPSTSHSTKENLICDTDFYFNAERFVVISNSIDWYFELLKDGKLYTLEEKLSDEDLYYSDNITVKGLAMHASKFDEALCYFCIDEPQENYNKYSNITLGSPRETVEELLGEGYVGTNQEYPTVMYNNGKVTMVIQYETVETLLTDESGNPIPADTVYAIYLINNN